MGKMEVSTTSITVSIFLVAIATWAWWIFEWLWFKPKRLERKLRQQVLTGKPYRVLVGDMKEDMMMIQEARSQPIDVSDDIAPRLLPFVLQTIKNKGKNTFHWLGPIPRVNIMYPEQIKEILTRIYEFEKPISNPLIKFLISGMAIYEGDKWAKHRKLINPAFNLEKLKLMVPAFCESCNDMVSEWEKLVSAERSVELDIWPDIQNLTCDAISRTAFGSNYKEGKRIFDLLKELVGVTTQVLQKAYIPGWRFLPTKANRRIKGIHKEIQVSLRNMICKREEVMKAGELTKNDLLGILLESNLKEIEEHGNNKIVGMTTEDVIDECKLFYFAGQETTAALLLWTMVILSKYPHWQAQAREEVFQIFGNNVPDSDGLNRLKVVTMILYEVLRLYPPTVFTDRNIRKDTKLGNLLLPAGVQVSIPVLLVHRSKEFWGDDASEFNPERFSGGVANATKNRVIFFPFSWGPRICIGQNFALMEAKAVLSMILQKFSFELSSSYVHAPISAIIIKPQHGAQLILHKL